MVCECGNELWIPQNFGISWLLKWQVYQEVLLKWGSELLRFRFLHCSVSKCMWIISFKFYWLSFAGYCTSTNYACCLWFRLWSWSTTFSKSAYTCYIFIFWCSMFPQTYILYNLGWLYVCHFMALFLGFNHRHR